MVKKLFYSILIATILMIVYATAGLLSGDPQGGVAVIFAIILFLPLVLLLFIGSLVIPRLLAKQKK